MSNDYNVGQVNAVSMDILLDSRHNHRSEGGDYYSWSDIVYLYDGREKYSEDDFRAALFAKSDEKFSDAVAKLPTTVATIVENVRKHSPTMGLLGSINKYGLIDNPVCVIGTKGLKTIIGNTRILVMVMLYLANRDRGNTINVMINSAARGDMDSLKGLAHNLARNNPTDCELARAILRFTYAKSRTMGDFVADVNPGMSTAKLNTTMLIGFLPIEIQLQVDNGDVTKESAILAGRLAKKLLEKEFSGKDKKYLIREWIAYNDPLGDEWNPAPEEDEEGHDDYLGRIDKMGEIVESALDEVGLEGPKKRGRKTKEEQEALDAEGTSEDDESTEETEGDEVDEVNDGTPDDPETPGDHVDGDGDDTEASNDEGEGDESTEGDEVDDGGNDTPGTRADSAPAISDKWQEFTSCVILPVLAGFKNESEDIEELMNRVQEALVEKAREHYGLTTE